MEIGGSSKNVSTDKLESKLDSLLSMVANSMEDSAVKEVEQSVEKGIERGVARALKEVKKADLNLQKVVNIEKDELEEEVSESVSTAIDNGIKKGGKKKSTLSLNNKIDSFQKQLSELSSKKTELDLKIKTDGAEKATKKINDLISSTQSQIESLSNGINDEFLNIFERYGIAAGTKNPSLINKSNKSFFSEDDILAVTNWNNAIKKRKARLKKENKEFTVSDFSKLYDKYISQLNEEAQNYIQERLDKGLYPSQILKQISGNKSNSYAWKDVQTDLFAGTAEIKATQLSNIEELVSLVAKLDQYYKAIGKDMPGKYWDMPDDILNNQYLFSTTNYDQIAKTGQISKRSALKEIEEITQETNTDVSKSFDNVDGELENLKQKVTIFINKELKKLQSALSEDISPDSLLQINETMQKMFDLASNLHLDPNGETYQGLFDFQDKILDIADIKNINLDETFNPTPIQEQTKQIEKNTEAKKENNGITDDSSEVAAVEKEADAIREETAVIEANTEAKKENSNLQNNTDFLSEKVKTDALAYEEVLSIVKEIASISEQYSKHTLDLQGSKYDRYDRYLEDYGLTFDSSLEEYQTKLVEVYKLYKNVQSAVRNNAGMFKGERYNDSDLSHLKNMIGAISSYIGALGGSFDETIAKVPKMTKEFKTLVEESIQEGASIEKNNKAWSEEGWAIDEANEKLKERLYLLENILSARTSTYRESIGISDTLMSVDFSDKDFVFGDVESKTEKICQILGIELPQASDKAEQSIVEDVQKISASIENETQSIEKLNQTKREETPLSDEDIAKRELITKTIIDSFEAQEKLNEVKKEEIPTSTEEVENKKKIAQATIEATQAQEKLNEVKKEEPETKSDDSSNIGKLVEAKREFTEINEKAAESAVETSESTAKEGMSALEAAEEFVKAAQAKREFVEANKQTQQSAEQGAESVKEETEAIDALERAAKNAGNIIDGIYNNQKGSLFDDSFSYTRHDANSVAQKYEGRGVYDDQGNLSIDEKIRTDYDLLKKEILKTDSAILQLQYHIQEMNNKGIDATGWENELRTQEQYLIRLEDEAERYFNSLEHLSGQEHQNDLLSARMNNALDVANKQTQKLAQSDAELSKKVLTASRNLDDLESALRGAGEYTATTARDLNSLRNSLMNIQTPRDFDNFVDQLKRFQSTQKAVKSSDYTKQNKAAAKAYDDLYNKAGRYYELLAKQSNDTITSGEQKELNELSQAWIDAKNRKHEYYYTDTDRASNSSRKAVLEARDRFLNSDTDAFESKATTLLTNYQKTINKILSNNTQYTADYERSLNDLYNKIEQINKHPLDLNTDSGQKELQNLLDDCQKLIGQKGFGGVKEASSTALNKFKADIERIVTENTNLGDDLKKRFSDLFEKANIGISVEELAKLKSEFAKLRGEMYKSGQAGKNFFDTLKQRIVGVNAQFLAQYFSWQDWIRYIREAAQAVVGLDSALTELRKVSDASTERLNQSFEQSAKTAQELGQTIEHVINVTADWSRLGYSVDDAERLAKVTALFTTVGDNMTADDASSYLISTMQGFQIAADDAMTIVDKYNEVDFASIYSNIYAMHIA